MTPLPGSECAMLYTRGGKDDCRPRREADDEVQVLEDEMPTLVRIERSEGGDLTWNARAIARVGVEVCDRRWAEVEATGRIGTPTGKVHVELGLVLAYRIHGRCEGSAQPRALETLVELTIDRWRENRE